jgi:hypothetical protein
LTKPRPDGQTVVSLNFLFLDPEALAKPSFCAKAAGGVRDVARFVPFLSETLIATEITIENKIGDAAQIKRGDQPSTGLARLHCQELINTAAFMRRVVFMNQEDALGTDREEQGSECPGCRGLMFYSDSTEYRRYGE